MNELDARTLDRIRKLLAKAEHPATPQHEAEAFSAKASALMARHAIDLALLEATEDTASAPEVRELDVDPPYALPRAVLLDRVARAHRVRVVIGPDVPSGARRCTLVGFAVDLDIVEVLFTSLLLQASTAMLVASADHPRPRAFRRAFLLGYATAIGERLATATEETDAAADAERPGTALVLAGRSREVEAELAKHFPHLRSLKMTTSSGRGVAAGRAAGASADLMNATQVRGDRRRALG